MTLCTFVGAAEVMDKADVSGASHRWHTHVTQECALGGAAGGGKDVRTQRLADLDGCQTDTPGAGMDERLPRHTLV